MDHRFGGQHQYVLFHFRLTYIYVNTSYFIVLLFDHELWFEKSWALQLQLVTNLNDKVAILVLLPAAKRLAIYLPCQSVDVLCDSYRSTAPLAQRKQINIPTTPPTHVLDVANVILRHAPHLRLCGHKVKNSIKTAKYSVRTLKKLQQLHRRSQTFSTSSFDRLQCMMRGRLAWERGYILPRPIWGYTLFRYSLISLL